MLDCWTALVQHCLFRFYSAPLPYFSLLACSIPLDTWPSSSPRLAVAVSQAGSIAGGRAARRTASPFWSPISVYCLAVSLIVSRVPASASHCLPSSILPSSPLRCLCFRPIRPEVESWLWTIQRQQCNASNAVIRHLLGCARDRESGHA